MALAMLTFGTVTAGPVVAQGKQARPNIEGTWKFNALRSDKAEDKLQALDAFARGPMTPPAGGPPQGQPPGSQGVPGGPGRMPYGRSGGIPDQNFMMDLRYPPQTLTLVLTDTSVAVEDEAGRALHLPVNGKKVRELTPAGTRIDRSAEWKKDGDLVITEKTNSGTTMRRTCRLDPVTHRLTVLVRFEGDRLPQPIEIRRVYDRVPPG
jgi:hypothetical protein